MTTQQPIAPSVVPVIALAMGDPAGISPELTAKLLASEDVRGAARLVVFGDWRVLARGAEVAGVALDVVRVADGTSLPPLDERPVVVDLAHLDPATLSIGEAQPEGGRFATENFRRALLFARDGSADAVCFTPFNKKAMRFAYPEYDDENRFVADVIGWTGSAREFNVLGNLWNARVTSHIPLSKVASEITTDGILRELRLTEECLRAAGVDAPRIAIAALNPHAGEGGAFGREEIDIIAPAAERAQADGMRVHGPYPADTVFLRAQRGECDAVLTMYHDQGQIAMKLIGFDKGVTLLGGFPFPICTPAHGTAYDIAGRGIANVSASKQAVLLAARMASRNRSGG